MLIHIGDNEFISEKDCIAIFNLSTLDEATKKRIFTNIRLEKLLGRSLSKDKLLDELKLRSKESMIEELLRIYKSAILKSNGRWILSTISTEALIHRSVADIFKDAYFVQGK